MMDISTSLIICKHAEITNIDFFIASLKLNKIIAQDTTIKCDFLEYKTILKTIFSYNNLDEIYRI